MRELSEAQHLAPSTITLWRVQRFIRMLTFGIPMLIALGWGASAAIPGELDGKLAAVVVITLIAMNAVFAVFWPTL